MPDISFGAPCERLSAHQRIHPISQRIQVRNLRQLRLGALGVLLTSIGLAGNPELRRIIGGQHHADGNRFTVHQGAVIEQYFQGVSEGVAEIEQRAVALFGFIAGHDVGFQPAASGNGLLDAGWILRSQRCSPELASRPRSYKSFAEMAQENAASRVFLGVHYRMDCEEGMRVGKLVGQKIANLQLLRKEAAVLKR